MPKKETGLKAMGANVIAGFVVMGLQWLIREAPGLYASISALINKKDVTDADFEAAKAQIAKDDYSSIVTNSGLPEDA